MRFLRSFPAVPAVGLFLLPWSALAGPAWDTPRFHLKLDHAAHNDTLAWSLLGVLGLTLSMVGACGWGIYRQFRKPTAESELLDGICPGESSGPSAPSLDHTPPTENPDKLTAPLPKGEAWEKPADWWK